jgi:hypothetical protein
MLDTDTQGLLNVGQDHNWETPHKSPTYPLPPLRVKGDPLITALGQEV